MTCTTNALLFILLFGTGCTRLKQYQSKKHKVTKRQQLAHTQMEASINGGVGSGVVIYKGRDIIAKQKVKLGKRSQTPHSLVPMTVLLFVTGYILSLYNFLPQMAVLVSLATLSFQTVIDE
jgi:hypothetical protein